MNANERNSQPMLDDAGLQDGGVIGNLPRFAPPESEQAVAPSLDQPSVAPVTSNEPATFPATTEAIQGSQPETPKEENPQSAAAVQVTDAADDAGSTAKAENEASDKADLNKKPDVESAQDALPSLEDQLRAVASLILAQRGADASQPQTRLTDEELARVSQHLNLQGGLRPDVMGSGQGVAPPNSSVLGMTAGQSVQVKGGAALAEGVGALVGGTFNLVGAAGKAAGQAAHSVADWTRSKLAGDTDKAAQAEAAASGLPAVLPRLSEYRITQVEKAAASFGTEADAFWNSSNKMTALRAEMERVARERGLSVQDVAQKMKPGGDFAELRQKFNEAVTDNPEAGGRRKAMDKALDSYVRQFGRAQEELLNPEQHGNPHYDRYKQRLNRAHTDIENNAAGVPAFENDKGTLDPSHFEKLREAVARIMEKVKEVAQEFIAMFSGKSSDHHAPGP
jgi:hypothetical protein